MSSRGGFRSRRRSPPRRRRRGWDASGVQAPRKQSPPNPPAAAARIDKRPRQGSGERHETGQSEAPGRACGKAHLFDGPFRAGLRAAPDLGRCETVERFVEGRVDRHELALQVRREIGDLDPVSPGDAHDLVAVGVGLGGFREIEQAAVPARELHALIAERSGPAADRVERIEQGRIARELSEVDGRALHGFHGSVSHSLPTRVGGRVNRTNGGRTGMPASAPRPDVPASPPLTPPHPRGERALVQKRVREVVILGVVLRDQLRVEHIGPAHRRVGVEVRPR